MTDFLNEEALNKALQAYPSSVDNETKFPWVVLKPFGRKTFTPNGMVPRHQPGKIIMLTLAEANGFGIGDRVGLPDEKKTDKQDLADAEAEREQDEAEAEKNRLAQAEGEDKTEKKPNAKK